MKINRMKVTKVNHTEVWVFWGKNQDFINLIKIEHRPARNIAWNA